MSESDRDDERERARIDDLVFLSSRREAWAIVATEWLPRHDLRGD
jgi:hypothetical protein